MGAGEGLDAKMSVVVCREVKISRKRLAASFVAADKLFLSNACVLLRGTASKRFDLVAAVVAKR